MGDCLMPDFRQMETEFAQVEGGAPRLSAIRRAYREADAACDLTWQFAFRFDYLKESIFSGDRYCAMIVFPDMLSLYDNHLELQENPRTAFNTLVAFKWIVEAAPEFPQISKADIDSYFRLFKKRLVQQGYSLSIYYMKHQLFYMHCDKSVAAADFYRFLDAPLDILSDGLALYHDQQAMYYLTIGEEEKALRAAKPIFDGRMRSNALPQSTYHDFLRFYLERGNYEEALRYAQLTEHRVNKDPYYLDIIGSLMTLYSQVDREHAIELFSQNYPVYHVSKNPMLRMRFEMGAYALFVRCVQSPPAARFVLPQSSQLFPLSERQDHGGMSAHFESSAAAWAKKFDARNGTSDFMDMLYFAYPEKTGG